VIFPPARNDPAHSAPKIRQFLNQKQVETLNHLPYSPDLSLPDYFLFPKVKLQLKGARFNTNEESQKDVTDQLNKIPAEDISNAMKKLETRANLCITSNRSYLKKINRKNARLLFFSFYCLSPGTYEWH
jgi:hypothetical protein